MSGAFSAEDLQQDSANGTTTNEYAETQVLRKDTPAHLSTFD